MKLFFFYFLIVLCISFPFSYSKAECIKSSTDGETVISCETEETSSYNLSGFTENNNKTNIVPTYQNNSVYATLVITGINVNSENHVMNIGDPNNSANPRIDVEINNFNNKSGNETINLYGVDSYNNPSSLVINNLKNDYGNLNITGEAKNKVKIDQASILGNFYLNNLDATLININAKNILLEKSTLNLDVAGEVNVENINIDSNSNINIVSNGEIGSISAVGDILFSGENTIIRVNKISSLGKIVLSNNMNVIVDEIYNNNKIVFLGEGKLTSTNLTVKTLDLQGETKYSGIKNSNINIANEINSENIKIKNFYLDINANNINVDACFCVENSTLNIKSNIKAGSFVMDRSNVVSNDDLITPELRMLSSDASFNYARLTKGLLLENSLLKVKYLDLISFDSFSYLNITLGDHEVYSDNNLSKGIYSEGDINISKNVDLNLLSLSSRGIKEGESLIYKIMYSAKGNINYNPNHVYLNDRSDILSVDYNIVKDKGTSFFVEIKRDLSYCEALSKAGNNCSPDNNIEYKGGSFVTDTAIVLDAIIKEGVPVTDNLSDLISSLDQSSLENLEYNLLSLKPISNDVILFDNYQNSKFIKNLHINNSKEGQSVSIFSSKGKVEDSILNTSSVSSSLGAYYGFSFNNSLGIALALSKSNINNNLYDVENIGLTVLSSYDFSVSDINLELMGGYGINKYDRDNFNFSGSNSQSSSVLSNSSIRFGIYKNYSIKDVVISPKVYYDISYLTISGYKEIGEGYLYEVLSGDSLVTELNLGVEASYNVFTKSLITAGANVFCLDYSSDDLLAKPHETSDRYIVFNNGTYSGLGFSANLGIDYEIKKTDFNLSYNTQFYENKSFFNGLTLTVKL